MSSASTASASASASSSSSSATTTTDRQVLPTNVVPSHYAITLRPDLEQHTFAGQEQVDIAVVQSTAVVSFNTLELRVTAVSVHPLSEGETDAAAANTANTAVVNAVEVSTSEATQVTSARFAEPLAVGTYRLDIVFEGTLNDKMVGFYRSEYQDKEGHSHAMATTQFEATDARRAFPCWDEPSLKATFEITLVIPNTAVGLSNMNVVRETNRPDSKKEVVFAKSPIMSTYLVAFCVGDLDFVEDRTPEGVQIRVYTPIGCSEQGEFALSVATKTLSFFSNFYQIPYPLPKLDLIAIPDFASGAMENWGLVTYRTVYLLYDEKNSSLTAKKNIAYVIAHELAHQWFGNLVTMEWWTHLWLNEGFATYVGWFAVDHLFPDWDVWTDFLPNEQFGGLELDSLRSSHPIEVDVKKPEEIEQIFDHISYAKGASIIRMLAKYLGRQVFADGLRYYLNKHKYANATTQDLWASLTKYASCDVAQLMSVWTQAIGYPLIEVGVTETGVVVSQQRYLRSEQPNEQELQQLWWVPLNMKFREGPKKDVVETYHLLKDKTATFPIPAGSTFLKINSMQCGFYRVRYLESALPCVMQAIESGSLAAADRVGILEDAFALAYSGHMETDAALSLLSSFKNEDNFVVWNAINSSLSKLKSVWYQEPQEILDRIDRLGRSLYVPQVKRLGWEFAPGESNNVAQMRALVLFGAGKCGDPEVVAEAKERFQRYADGDEAALHPDIRGAVFRLVVLFGGAEEFTAVQDIYLETTYADVKKSALIALGATKDEDLIEQVLQFSLSDSVRSQDVVYLTSALGNNLKARDALWEFVKANWTTLAGRYRELPTLSAIVARSTEGFASQDMADSVAAFFQGVPAADIASATRAIQQSQESIRGNARWLERGRTAVSQWLAAANVSHL